MSDIWKSVTAAQQAPLIQSFGPGGQGYIYDMETGFMITSERTNPIFDFASTDKSVANAEFLTNLTEAKKIGSTMDFKAMQICFRVTKVDGSECSPAELAAMKLVLASARVRITYGSNDTLIGEYSGAHIQAPVDNVCADSTATSMSQSGGIGNTAWINLPVPIPMQANLNIGGSVRFTLPVPAALLPANPGDPELFAFKVMLAGLKNVK